MGYYLKIANEQMDEMEALLSKDNNLTYEEEEKLQELYHEVKENLEIGADEVLGGDRYLEKRLKNLNESKKRFKALCEEFETPDDIINSTLNNLFPDEDSMEGFDW
ncbi:hypothetical protein [Saprospira grandis]|uniref:hypothetical protein n=1 Tax=Saprospira grandis TaxID=1008 RepID=UPI0022DE617D|nr:hypothetical protein [Saprospira grandis]WBM73457.1 hypothetical protein OP864_10685 [Saprospira grandis]